MGRGGGDGEGGAAGGDNKNTASLFRPLFLKPFPLYFSVKKKKKKSLMK